ncbi:MAG: chromosomal replication initiator protein DnaA [Lachnospiraceae bacterium]|nr:chromosomal replication initiator protein DnaA [Lachnospiraceae bacterium]
MNAEDFKNEEYWVEIKKKIQRESNVSDITYHLWFEHLEFHELSGDTVYIKTEKDDERALGYLNNKFKLYFETVIGEELGRIISVVFLLSNAEHTPAQAQIPEENRIDNDTLNPDYTFESFVVGKNNMMAHQVSVAVAEDPGKTWNPLYIYGGPGLGKTHLMHSIGHFIINKDPSKKVIYVTGSDFTNDVIESLRSGNSVASMSKLREKYRSVDVLMIDDIQFIIGKESTQEEFFHTFNTLHDAGKQIIIASDRNFKEFKTLDERYVSRFAWGMVVDITPPDYETRSAILKNYAEKINLKISEEIIDYVASNMKSNVRELEGSLKKIQGYIKLFNIKEPDLEIAKEALKDYIYPSESNKITFDRIVDVVCQECNISKEAILSNKRTAEIVYPRHIIMYLAYDMLGITYKQIAEYLKRSDHTTVLSACNKIAEDINSNKSGKNTREKVESIKKILTGALNE